MCLNLVDMTIKIEKGIPLPGFNRRSYPWVELKKGESFLVKTANQGLRTQASRAARAYGRKFAVRKVEGGMRVWRVR